MFWRRKPKCNHFWHHLQDGSTVFSYHRGAEDSCWIFCSDCEEETQVRKGEWQRTSKKQEITADKGSETQT